MFGAARRDRRMDRVHLRIAGRDRRASRWSATRGRPRLYWRSHRQAAGEQARFDQSGPISGVDPVLAVRPSTAPSGRKLSPGSAAGSGRRLRDDEVRAQQLHGGGRRHLPRHGGCPPSHSRRPAGILCSAVTNRIAPMPPALGQADRPDLAARLNTACGTKPVIGDAARRGARCTGDRASWWPRD